MYISHNQHLYQRKNPILAPSLQAYVCSQGLETQYISVRHHVSVLGDAGCITGSWILRCDSVLGDAGCIYNNQKLSTSPRWPIGTPSSTQADAPNFIALLKACGRLKDLERGREIHLAIKKNELHKTDPFVCSMLVDMYAKCGSLAEAQGVFDTLPFRDVVTWTALIAGYAQNNNGNDALNHYEQMQLEGVFPNAFTVSCILKVCGSLGGTSKGREIHASVACNASLQTNLFVLSALVDMYAKCADFVKAEEVFGSLSSRDVVLWTALISGYVNHAHVNEAMKCFGQMQHEGISPNVVTYACVLKACGNIGDTEKGRDIHGDIAKKGLLRRDLVLSNALIDMYAKCGMLAEAKEVFDSIQVRDVVSWTALIAGYTDNECGEDACVCFTKMRLEGVTPDAFAFTICLKACGNIGAAGRGEEIHIDIESTGSLNRDLVVGTALVDMYAKCGLLDKAQGVFDKLLARDKVLWNSLVTGYSQHGDIENVLCVFDQMRVDGFEPHPVTFVSIINACSHAGSVDMGQMCFEIMRKDYGITPVLEHLTCMVDLFSRAGQLDKAMAMMKSSPCHPNAMMWLTILAACRKSNNLEVGRQTFQYAVGSGNTEPAVYVGMYNLYAEADIQEVGIEYYGTLKGTM